MRWISKLLGMLLEFASDLSDRDLWDIDLLNTDFLDADISSKHFVCLQNDLQDKKSLCWRRVEDVFKARLEDQQMFPGL